ncbi:MAG: hypothetical protein IJV22_06260 [Bacteroidales bacterium]|nr:hypothetical protein [Bacteroidales bacterium]
MKLPTSLVISRGTILHSTVFNYIDHGKFFVIIGESEEKYVGFFFINSDINPINRKPEQLKMQYLLHKADYAFLRYDSYLCCTQVSTIPKAELEASIASGATSVKGILREEHMDDVLGMVRKSKLFSLAEKTTFFK